MLPKERFRAAFYRTPTDRVPVHHIGFSSQVASAVLGREAYVGGGIQQWREACALWDGEEAHAAFLERSLRDAFDLSVVLGHDLVRLHYWRLSQRPTRRIDDHAFLYGDPDGDWCVRRFDPPTETYQITDQHPAPATVSDFVLLEAGLAAQEATIADYEPGPDDFAGWREAFARFGAEHALRIDGGHIAIPYDPALWLEATALRPDLVGRLLDVAVERLRRSVGTLAAVGVEYLFGGGDMASNDGPFYSPRAFHELVAPRLKQITDACHRHGIRYLFASDGDLWPVAPDMFGTCGVDGYHEIDRLAGMDLRRLREAYPSLTLLGNLSSRTLHTGTVDEVRAETLDCLDTARELGGIVVGLSNYAVPGTPPENLEAMLRTIEDNR
jgi:hypothetical protein